MPRPGPVLVRILLSQFGENLPPLMSNQIPCPSPLTSGLPSLPSARIPLPLMRHPSNSPSADPWLCSPAVISAFRVRLDLLPLPWKALRLSQKSWMKSALQFLMCPNNILTVYVQKAHKSYAKCAALWIITKRSAVFLTTHYERTDVGSGLGFHVLRHSYEK